MRDEAQTSSLFLCVAGVSTRLRQWLEGLSNSPEHPRTLGTLGPASSRLR